MCADLACGAITVHVDHTHPGQVAWSGLRHETGYEPRDDLDLALAGTFVFDAEDYRATLLAPVPHLDALAADEQAVTAARRPSRPAPRAVGARRGRLPRETGPMLFDHAPEPAPPRAPRARRGPEVTPTTSRPRAGTTSRPKTRTETRTEADNVLPGRAPEGLDLAETVGREWDIVMTREGRWVRVSTAITDPDEVRRQLDWYRLSNSAVTFHVIERTATLREQLVDEDAVAQP